MEILNKREKRLYKELKNIIAKERVIFILLEDLPKWNTLLDKISASNYIKVVRNEAFVAIYEKSSDFKQFEIEQKEAIKEDRKNTSHDYKVAIVSGIIGTCIGSLIALWL